jgi:DNA-binding transcriptional ArsR family regulator
MTRTLSKDEIFDLMRHEQRRIIVHLLLKNPSEWDIERLVKLVTDQISESADETADGLKSRMTMSLIHHHLPRLADNNMISFDATKQTEAPGNHTEDLVPLV